MDSLSSEYFKAFSKIPTYKLFNYSANNQAFPKEILEAVIITIPKQGKDPMSPSNSRPISLLNVDLKIYSKVLANCLLEITPFLIKSDQVGFDEGHQSPDSIRRMVDLINRIENNQIPSLLLGLDAQKAFDRVHWGYIAETLKKFGYAFHADQRCWSPPPTWRFFEEVPDCV